MRIRKATIFAVVAILIGAQLSCTVGPNYQAPEVTVPADFKNPPPASTQPTTRSLTESSEIQPIAQWWMTLHDVELDKLIDRAVAGNIDLQSAASRVRQSRAALRETGAQEKPKISAAGAFAQIDTGKNPLLGGGKSMDAGLWQAGFDTSWEIDIFGGQRRQIEAAQADLQAAIEEHNAALISLTAEVARDYLELRGLQQRLKYARENLALEQDTLGLTQSLHRAGFNTELDVSRAETEVNQTRAEIVPWMTQLSEHQHAIATLLGIQPDSLVDELNTTAPNDALPSMVSVGLPADLLRRRPDIRRAERQIAAANARVGAAIADYYPKFSLTGDFGVDSTEFTKLFGWESRYLLLYPNVSWNLLDFGRTKARVDQQRELYKQATLTYQSTVLTALREVEDAMVAYSNEQDHHAALAAAVASARESVEISRNEYKQGIIDFLPILDAQRQLLSAQDELAESEQTLNTNLVALYKALGGGWEVQETIKYER